MLGYFKQMVPYNSLLAASINPSASCNVQKQVTAKQQKMQDGFCTVSESKVAISPYEQVQDVWDPNCHM